jgi:hypothetical protein
MNTANGIGAQIMPHNVTGFKHLLNPLDAAPDKYAKLYCITPEIND